MLLAFVGLDLVSSVPSQDMAGKNVSEITYSVSSAHKTLTQLIKQHAPPQTLIRNFGPQLMSLSTMFLFSPFLRYNKILVENRLTYLTSIWRPRWG